LLEQRGYPRIASVMAHDEVQLAPMGASKTIQMLTQLSI
jgi:hypothetical protein